jgi:hypothetical protein
MSRPGKYLLQRKMMRHKIAFFISHATLALPQRSRYSAAKYSQGGRHTAMEIHSCVRFLRPALKFHSYGGRSGYAAAIPLPGIPGCDIKPDFLLAMYGHSVKKANNTAAQTWYASAAMEFHNHVPSCAVLTAAMESHSWK